AAPRTGAGQPDHPAHPAGAGTGVVVVLPGLLAAGHPAPRAGPLPHQDRRRAAGDPRADDAHRRRVRAVRHRPGDPQEVSTVAKETRKYQPRGGIMAAGTPPLLVVLALWGVVALVFLVWLAAWLAALVTPGEVAPFGVRWAFWLFTGDTESAWPGTPTFLVVLFCVVQ